MGHYEVLGVAASASTEEIERAFRREIKRWHPDVNGNSQESNERTKRLVEAREVLLDPQARREYDQKRRSSTERPEPRRTGQAAPSSSTHGSSRSNPWEQPSTSAYDRARARAADQAGRTLDDWLESAWRGDPAFATFVARFLATLQVGALTYLTIGLFALSATGILAPLTIPLGIVLSRTIMGMLFVGGRWVGFKMILNGLWVFPLALALLIGLFQMFQPR